MNNRKLCLVIALVSIFSLPYANANPPIVRADGVEFGPGGSFGDYGFLLWQDPVFSDPTSVGMDYSFGSHFVTLTGTFYNLDEGSSWFFLRAGDVLSPQKIAAGEYDLILGHREASLGSLESNSVVFSPFGDFFNGLEDGNDDFYLGVSGVPYFMDHADVERDIFGWVKLRYISGNGILGIEYVESVVSYNSPGIIVGTTQTIPEPSTLALLVLGLVSLRPRYVAGRSLRSGS